MVRPRDSRTWHSKTTTSSLCSLGHVGISRPESRVEVLPELEYLRSELGSDYHNDREGEQLSSSSTCGSVCYP